MKKLFKYIENIWLGDDGKPSGKRVTALAMTVHVIISISSGLNSYINLVKAVYLHDPHITPELISSAGQSLSSLAMVIGIEVGAILALWGVASYQSVQQGRNNLIKDGNIKNLPDIDKF